jgi:phosphoglycolate phosphatase
VRAVLFDLDGTLVDSQLDVLGAFASAFGALGLPKPPDDDLRGVIGMRLEDCFARFVGADEALYKEGARLFREWYKDHYLDGTRPYPGADEALRALAQRVPIALCTMKKWQFARKILEAFGWTGLFREVLGAEEGFPAKPDPAMLLELCRRLGAAPGEVLYVGDTAMDAGMAQRAGAPFAFAAYGYGPSESVADFPKVATLAHASEIAGLWKD